MSYTKTSHPMNRRDDVNQSDIAAVRQLVADTGFFRPDEIEIAVELVEERLTKGVASGYHFEFLDDSDGKLAGYACFGPIACTIGSFDLYWIAVHPSHQGHGLGRELMTTTESRVRAFNGRRIYIETSSQPKYESTRRFYVASGYSIDATIRDFYAPGDDKLIYVRSL